MKRLIFCLDGTWNDNETGSTPTNILRLHQSIAPTDDKGVRQISHYVEGIASAEGERAQFVRGAVGQGVSDRIRRAYELLVASYEPGDEIYLFGFSRGAFEARSLAGFIALVGVGKKGPEFALDKAWSLYRTSEAKRSQEELSALRAAAYYPVRIKCLGVWDTVGNIGNPFFSGGLVGRKLAFHDTRLSDTVDIALHALSIDEKRGPFRPMLWTLPEGQMPPANQHVEQVWFAGTHADVGGGWRESALSDISLLWMAERVKTKAGLAFDAAKLASLTRPDPLGPQHSSTTGRIFRWSGLIPFIRLIKQTIEAVSPLRLTFLGAWRTGKVAYGLVPVNESIHESVVQRFGQKVVELTRGRSHQITYRPANLVPVLPEPQTPAAKPTSGKPRRVKVFTVHGTFAYETTWDDWDGKDDESKPGAGRHFINRLSGLLRKQGVVVDALDHSQYNWSGGNSHDERRTAAIGLKKHIENVLTEDYARHGKDYYDGVYIISHSHGGTISRMAMNLWDKGHDYYDPVKSDMIDEFKHDDQCATCKRARNGIVGPSTVPRPDGVITFGSPFVTFEKRKAGLLTARLGAWVFRAFALVIAAALLGLGYIKGENVTEFNTPDLLLTPLRLGWALIITWLLAFYLPGTLLPRLERWFGKGTLLYAVNAILQVIKYAVLAAFAVYIAAYIYGKWTGTGGWEQAKLWLPFITNHTLQYGLAWMTLIGLSWALVITLPGRFLRWLRRKVVPLGVSLPKKYDPSEDRVVTYLSYHSPGDEAGAGLRFFNSLTWLIQTFGLAAACMLALGVILLPYITIEALLHVFYGEGILSRLGVSAFSSNMEHRDKFIVLMDWLTYLPNTILPYFGNTGFETLGNLPNARDVAWWIPLCIVITLLVFFMLLMPVMVVLLGFAYLVAMWLRRSGMVFGGESMAWNLANRIAVSRRPNANTVMRVVPISPEAWWRKEIAHCYYYKSDRVIADVANSIANWSALAPAPALPIGSWISTAARGLVVAVAMLSIFAGAIPIANALATNVGSGFARFFGGDAGTNGTASRGDPTATPSGSAPECPADAGTAVATAPGVPTPPTGERQVLRRIRGIDAQIEVKLNELGISTYEQIANWTCADINRINQSLDFKGRIERENWVAQARILAQGGSTAFSRNFDARETLVEDGKNICRSEVHSVQIELIGKDGQTDWDATYAKARPIWEAEVAKTYGAEWANWQGSSGIGDGKVGTISSKVCKPRTFECQEAIHIAKYDFELPPGITASTKETIRQTVEYDMKIKWSSEVQEKFGPAWVSTAKKNFETLRTFERPIEEGCKEEVLDGDRIRYHCSFATAPCKETTTAAAAAQSPAPATPATVQSAAACKSEKYSVTVPVELPPGLSLSETRKAVQAEARKVWEPEVSAKFGAEWASWDLSEGYEHGCQLATAEQPRVMCEAGATPCKPGDGAAQRSQRSRQ